ncbi:hypothetical protein [Georgenia ruanii]|uniref:hypothetical protein n=1 Tax=Georgenia ruanii TaxID=348442 RepID=UPI00126520BD|nr:hypothetical protein [Georgenia ruanii]
MGTVLTAVRAEPCPTDQDRLAAARAALTRAELAAGLRTRLDGPPATAVPAPGPRLTTSPALVAVPGDHARSVPSSPDLAGASAAPDAGAVPDAGPVPGDDRYLPVPGALAPLFPAGALARGSVVQVTGSTSVLLALAGAASADGAWCSLAALPDVGWRAGAAAGLALDRVAVVPRPGPDAAAVVGALVDGFDVLVVGPCPALGERDRRLLGSRLRTRGAVLLSTHPWPGAHLVLRAAARSWDGLGQGWGHLGDQELTVRATGRGGAVRAREVRIKVGAEGMRAPARTAAMPAAGPAGAPAAGNLALPAGRLDPAAGLLDPAAASPDAALLRAV